MIMINMSSSVLSKNKLLNLQLIHHFQQQKNYSAIDFLKLKLPKANSFHSN